MDELRLLCVCTHNRTRSVMAAALLGRRLEQLEVPATVHSAGTQAGGEPATHEAVRLLRARGLDVAGHRSRRADAIAVDGADLVVTAEHVHVVQLAGRSTAAFTKTFTLPELVGRAEGVGAVDGDLSTWLARVNDGRPAAIDYLDAVVPEIADPTGRSRRHWDAAYAEIDDLTHRLGKLLAT